MNLGMCKKLAELIFLTKRHMSGSTALFPSSCRFLPLDFFGATIICMLKDAG